MTSAQPARSSSDPPRGCDPRSEPVIKSLFDVRALAAKSAIDAGSLAVLSGVSVGDLLAFERFAIDGAAMLPVERGPLWGLFMTDRPEVIEAEAGGIRFDRLIVVG